VLSPGGLVTMVMMFVVGRLSGKVQPKYMIMTGAIMGHPCFQILKHARCPGSNRHVVHRTLHYIRNTPLPVVCVSNNL
jgi:hypothetical protein